MGKPGYGEYSKQNSYGKKDSGAEFEQQDKIKIVRKKTQKI